MQDKVEYWLDLADEDLKVADSMLKAKHYLYVGFMCHLTIEKALKAVVAHVTEGLPPKIHNLPVLAEKALLEDKMGEEQFDFIRELNPLNIEGRYPSYKEQVSQILSKEYCEKLIKRTEEMLCWIKQQLSVMPKDTQTK